MAFCKNIYEKIAIFHYVSTQIIILILINNSMDLGDAIDVVLLLFLLQLICILFLTFNKRKI